MFVRVERHVLGRRVWFGRWRCHHFHVGLALVAAGLQLIWRDRADVLVVFDPEVGVTTSHDKGVW